MEEIEIWYDDQPHDSAETAIFAANKLLKNKGLELTIQPKVEDERNDGGLTLEITLKENYASKKEG